MANRSQLTALLDLLLDSFVQHDPSVLPLARTYRHTTNNAGSSPSLSQLWRTVTSVETPADFHYVIDVPAQQAFVIAEVSEGGVPNLFWGRIRVDADDLITELELYISRANGDSGFMFDPTGLRNMPDEWTRPVPEEQLASRDELITAARAIFDPGYGTPPTSQRAYLLENGERVMGDMTPEKMRELLPWADEEMLARVEYEQSLPKDFDKPGYANLIPDRSRWGELSGLGSDLMADRPVDASARILVDEQTGTVISFGIVPGKAYPSFYWWYPELQTAFVPRDMLLDNQWRVERADTDPNFNGNVGRDPELPYIPLSEPVPSVLATTEVFKYFGGMYQGEHRLMQIQPVGSTSPWVGGD